MGDYSGNQRTDALDCMRALLGELRAMAAHAERCDMLAYLIEMAYVEASDVIRGGQPEHVRDERVMTCDGSVVLYSENERNRTS